MELIKQEIPLDRCLEVLESWGERFTPAQKCNTKKAIKEAYKKGGTDTNSGGRELIEKAAELVSSTKEALR